MARFGVLVSLVRSRCKFCTHPKTTAKLLGRLFAVAGVLFLAPAASAQCTTACLQSFTISPGSVVGDQSDFATATVQVYVGDPSETVFPVFLQMAGPGTLYPYCGAGQPFTNGCDFLVNQGNNTLTFYFSAYNGANATVNDTVTVSWGVNLSAPLAITPVQSYQVPPPNDPGAGGRCLHCEQNGGPMGAQPINFANGNTWITQQDYFMPGLAGGLTLTRTWNSLWPLTSPPEQSGIFGDSWRSSFEERIQTLTSQVKYWRGDGSALFYNYNSGTFTYDLVAPIDDQTTLSFNGATNHWTVTLKDGTQKIFNNAGYLTSIVDLNGSTTTINVDAANQNRIASITDASGHVLTFNYANTAFPRLCTSITDSVGTFSQYSYDSSGRLYLVQYPDGSQYNFQFNDPNSNTLISLVSDSQGKTVEAHTYDSQRRGVTAQQANDSTGHPVNQVTALYSSAFLQANQVSVYDSLGNSSTLTIRNVAQSHYLVAEGDACATCGYLMNAKAGVSSSGYKTVFTDGNGNTSYYSYDGQGNVVSKGLPEGNYYSGLTGLNAWTYTYNSLGEVLTATDPLSHTTTNTYDTRGNLTSVTTPSPDGTIAPSVTTFTPNAQGQVTQVQDPLGNKTTITYCTQNQTNCPYGLIYTIADAQSNVTTYSYDGRGNRLSVSDAASNVTQFQYDSMNRVTQITYPTSPATTVQFHYDWRGRRDYVIDQNGNKTTYGYDDADRLVSVTDAQTPTSGVTTYKYDTENNLTDIYDANTNHTRFYYNVHRQLQQITFPSGYYETYGWDLNNNLTSKTDRNSQTTNYYYDYQNHIYQKRYPDYTTVNYTYDAARRLKQVTDATGTYGFVYDNMNRLTEADTTYAFLSIGAKAVKYGYDAGSNRTSMTDPQNLGTAYGYDTLNRLSSLIFNGQNPGFTFGYDALSRRTSLTRPNSVNTTYAYDPVSRLTSILHKLGSTTLDGATYTYDKNGNTQTKSDGTQYTWDFENRLTQVMLPGSGGTVNFKYDPFGRRAQKSFTQGSTTTTTNYLYDGRSLLQEVDQSGNVLARYTQNRRIDEPLAEVRSGTTSYYDADGLQSITSLSSSGGALANTYAYDTFGNITNSTGSIVNPFRFTGREFDLETGAYFYRARYYDQNVGRFLSEDPLRYPDGAGFYIYVNNNPLNLFDPLGLCPWEIHHRRLRGVPGPIGDPLGLDHYYFWNTETGETVGLGPASGMGLFRPVPGQWETN